MTDISNKDVIQAWSNIPETLVEAFGDEGDMVRKHLLNAVLFGLLGDVNNKLILDAGCGQGYLSRLLTRKGARVTGIEPAGVWLNYALQRERMEPLGIRYLQADLSLWEPEEETFDYVVANMVFMDIPDYFAALQNCVMALKRGGGLIFSLLHPCFEESGSAWENKGFVEIQEYFLERAVAQRYGHFLHRPLSKYLNSVIQAGCVIQQILEPRLDEAIAVRYHAERYTHVPGYVVVFARKN